jgi:hypothetical protein
MFDYITRSSVEEATHETFDGEVGKHPQDQLQRTSKFVHHRYTFRARQYQDFSIRIRYESVPLINMSSQARGTILLLGGTGKVASRIAPLFSNGYSVLQASRSGSSSSPPNCHGVKFDWNDPTTYERPFENVSISAIFLVAPSTTDPFAPMKIFIDLAITKGVQRLVLLSASLMDVGDGPMMSKVSTYISLLNIEYAILRPTWFMGISKV